MEKRSGDPTLRRSLSFPVLVLYGLGTTRQLDFLPPGEKRLLARLNGSIMIYAPESLTHLHDIDPRKIARAAKSQKKLRDILNAREIEF